MSKLTRRQFVAGAGAAALVPALPAEVKAQLTPADVAWARLPKNMVYNFYKDRKYFDHEEREEQDQERANKLRYDLSVRYGGIYPYCPDNWNEEPRCSPKAMESRRAALHELIDELQPDDLWAVFDIARLFVQFPVDWPGQLAPRQQAHQKHWLAIAQAMGIED